MNGIVFIETRDIPGLGKIFEDHIKFVPEFEPLAVCSKENAYQFRGFKKMIVNIKSIADHNKLMTSSWFWDKLPYDKILNCEQESGILREGIEDFLEWDYVGAPWWFQSYGGNGGFSLRSVKVMSNICRMERFSTGNEDVYFCNAMRNHGMKLAPREVCEKFSVETVFKLGTFGYHLGKDAKRMLSESEINKIKNQCLSTKQI